MTKDEWIAAYTKALGEGSSNALLARETARVHEQKRGLDISTWPTIEQSRHPIFNTRDNTDIGIDDAEPEPKEKP
jgi:hypothetical protein